MYLFIFIYFNNVTIDVNSSHDHKYIVGQFKVHIYENQTQHQTITTYTLYLRLLHIEIYWRALTCVQQLYYQIDKHIV